MMWIVSDIHLSWLFDRLRWLELKLEFSSSEVLSSGPDPLRTSGGWTAVTLEPGWAAFAGIPAPEGVALEGLIRAPPKGVKGTAVRSFFVDAEVDLKSQELSGMTCRAAHAVI